jgi:hypothetical protein
LVGAEELLAVVVAEQERESGQQLLTQANRLYRSAHGPQFAPLGVVGAPRSVLVRAILSGMTPPCPTRQTTCATFRCNV